MSTSLTTYELYRKFIPDEFSKELNKKAGKERSGIFTASLVCWMMIWQRLEGGVSMLSATSLLSGGAWEDLRGSKSGRISSNTGGYSRAKKALSLECLVEVSDKIFLESSELIGNPKERRFFAVDGTTASLSSTEEVVSEYPNANHNGYNRSNKGVLMLLVAHDLSNGLAIRPEYDAHFGEKATSECKLLHKLFNRLPEESVLIGDRNFGIFRNCHTAFSKKHDVIFRMTDSRANKILEGAKVKPGMDKKVIWSPSRNELKKYPELSSDSRVEGRIICKDVKTSEGKKVRLILFTTLTESAVSIVKYYGYRWKVEIDLRSIKRTLGMHKLTAKTPGAIAKEVVMGIAAYNLTRALMELCKKLSGEKDIAYSFSHFLYIVRATTNKFTSAKNPDERESAIRLMIEIAQQGKLRGKRYRKSAKNQINSC